MAQRKYWLIIASLLTAVASAHAQVSSFVTTLGADTLAFEQFRRVGDAITGDWLTLYGGVMFHHYTIVLRPDGTVASYHLTLHRANGAPEGGVELTFDRDSVSVVNSADSGHVTRVAAPGALPIFANTIGLLEVITRHARAQARDSSMTPIVNAFGPYRAAAIPVVFFHSDSAWLGNPRAPLFVRVDGSGAIQGLSAHATTTRSEVRRVPAFDLSAVPRRFPDVSPSTPILGVLALSPRDTVRAAIDGATITIDYGRPAVRGRDVFAHGVLGDTIWRAGANAATQFTTSTALLVGGKVLAAGTYSLWVYAPPDNSSYELVFNGQHGQWGTEHHFEQDVLRVPLEVSSNAAPAERLTIQLAPASNGVTFRLQWSGTTLSVPIRRQ